jgi:hypothetical protein
MAANVDAIFGVTTVKRKNNFLQDPNLQVGSIHLETRVSGNLGRFRRGYRDSTDSEISLCANSSSGHLQFVHSNWVKERFNT